MARTSLNKRFPLPDQPTEKFTRKFTEDRRSRRAERAAPKKGPRAHVARRRSAGG
jgi:hypothetical protein